jgi:hypothetical protein
MKSKGRPYNAWWVTMRSAAFALTSEKKIVVISEVRAMTTIINFGTVVEVITEQTTHGQL